jgi:hypothetical protein
MNWDGFEVGCQIWSAAVPPGAELEVVHEVMVPADGAL